MTSERRLHPVSIVFALGGLLREFALPLAALLFTAGSAGADWQTWLLWLAIPYALAAVLRYATYRYRYEPAEIVVRSGLLFRRERHVPYARIQNLDAVRNVFHRLLGVVEVRVETGAGQEPEAVMRVLPLAAYEEMQSRVRAARGASAAATIAATDPAAPPAMNRILLQLGARELVLCGLVQNRGAVVIAAAFGVAWELGILDRVTGGVFGEEGSGRGVIRDVLRALFGSGDLPLERVALGAACLLGLLVVLRILSVCWALVKLHGFHVVRDGGALRAEFGSFTRVTASIPLRRIQTLTIHEGPLHRLFGRVAVRADTAGGGFAESATQREWLAPILRSDALPDFLREVLPELDFAHVEWRRPHPRAFRRELKGWIAIAIVLAAPFALLLEVWTLALLAVLAAWAWLGARGTIAQYGYAVEGGAVLYRGGWLWRYVSLARVSKIQAVGVHESPFDRRAEMAQVSVDTAGAGDALHRVAIPYLPRDFARDLGDSLFRAAARAAFRW